MSGEYPFATKLVSPVKCNEKPWDLWVSEIGHLSPRRDDDVMAPADVKSSASARRPTDHHPYKAGDRTRHRRPGLNRLKQETMNLHGLFPQMDDLNAAVCHMCGVIMKCSAVYRHILESHTGNEPLLPPPPSAPTVRSRSRHKKEPPPPPPPVPIDMHPVKMNTSPVHAATPPLSRLVMPPPEVPPYIEDQTSLTATDVQVCVEGRELPVVSIQDTDDLPLGENITEDILDIMNSEGIQSADDITDSTDWKNIIRDIGSMHDLNFPQAPDPVPSQEMYSTMHTASLPAYALTDADLSNLQFTSNTSPMLTSVIETSPMPVPVLPSPVPPPTPSPAKSTPSTPSSRSGGRKTSKSKIKQREYDPNKHCGVIIAETLKPCTRSLTCKAHALSLRRTVEGRAKPFDTLLAEHRAAAATPPAVPATPIPPLLVNNTPHIDLSTFNGLSAEQQVNDIYASLLGVEDGSAVLPDTSSFTSLLSQPLPETFLLPAEAEVQEEVPVLNTVQADEPPPTAVVPTDVCWYTSTPRPLAVCTFNASHAGGAITLGKKFATVRSNIKSSLTRSQCKTGTTNNYYYGSNALSLPKTVHINTSKCTKPEVRKLIVTCGSTSGKDKVQQTLSELFGGHALNGHVGKRAPTRHKRPGAVLDLGFSLDAALLADEKC